MLKHRAFSENDLSTKFCDEHTENILESIRKEKAAVGYKIPLFAYALHNLNKNKVTTSKNIWESIGHWRNIMGIPFEIDDNIRILNIGRMTNSRCRVSFEGENYDLLLEHINQHEVLFQCEDQVIKAYISTDEKGIGHIDISGLNFEVKRLDVLNENTEFVSAGASDNERNLFAPMPGKVIKVNVKAGDAVKRGTVMLVVEAMKMENNITAENDAIVESIAVKEGEMVDADVQLIYLTDSEN